MAGKAPRSNRRISVSPRMAPGRRAPGRETQTALTGYRIQARSRRLVTRAQAALIPFTKPMKKTMTRHPYRIFALAHLPLLAPCSLSGRRGLVTAAAQPSLPLSPGAQRPQNAGDGNN